MENNHNIEMNQDNGGKKSGVIVFVIILLIVCCCACVIGYITLNKNDDNSATNSNETTNTTMNYVDDDQTNSTSTISTEVNDEPSNESEIINDEGSEEERELLTKKDKDYVYTYYYDEEDEYGNEVVSFKIKDKDVIDDIGFVSEISEIKKYNDFIAIKANYVATCGPDHNDLFIFDYNGNILFKSGSISIEDLSKWKNTDDDDKWYVGQMQLASYKYNENDKQLEVTYSFNIYSVMGDCSGEEEEEHFCNASKKGTLYDNAVITTKFSNGKFGEETVSSKNVFNINNYDDNDKELYKESCK